LHDELYNNETIKGYQIKSDKIKEEMELSAKERDEYQIKVKYTEDFIKLLNNKLNE